ncbi:MAG: U32 family peptidase, partial [Sphingomonadales bacterium]
EPVSINLLSMLPSLLEAGVSAFKIEGRQRSRAYVSSVVSTFRAAIDAALAGTTPVLPDLLALTEGQKQTHGAFGSKKWR